MASLALGLVLTWRTSRVVNFAHAAMGTYLAYAYFEFRDRGDLVLPFLGLPERVHLLPTPTLAASLVFALVLSALVGLLVYWLVFRPLRQAHPLARVVASLGLYLYFQEITRLRFPTAGATAVTRFPVLPEDTVSILGTGVSANRLWLAAMVLVVTGVLVLVFQRTRFGLATRAAAGNEKAAVLTGIYTGAFTPTEAAAVAALHALLLAGVVYRALSWRTLYSVFLESTRSSAVITMIIAGAFMLNYAFTSEGVPQSLALWVDSMDLSQLQFLLLVNAVFLVLGCFLDVSVMLLVFVPMLLPAAKLLGIDLVHFGVVVVVNMMIGLVTPPFGMLLFVTNALTGISIRDMMREGWLFLLMLFALLLLMVLFPQIVLWLPQSMGYGLRQ